MGGKQGMERSRAGADLGGGGGGGGWYFFRNPFLADRPLSFSKGASGANIY